MSACLINGFEYFVPDIAVQGLLSRMWIKSVKTGTKPNIMIAGGIED